MKINLLMSLIICIFANIISNYKVMQHIETWKDIEENPYYQISNLGRIKILAHDYMHYNSSKHIPEKIKVPTNGKLCIGNHPYDIRTLMFKYFPSEYIEQFCKDNTLDGEEWRTIENFDNYQVSSLGRVRSLPKAMDSSVSINRIRNSKQELYTVSKNISLGKILKPVNIGKPDRDGLYRLAYILVKNNKRYQVQASRLVAETFIPNPNNLPEVNHKNRNILDNSASNLEWVTQEENFNHANLKRETLIPFYELAYKEHLSPDEMLIKLISFYKSA